MFRVSQSPINADLNAPLGPDLQDERDPTAG